MADKAKPNGGSSQALALQGDQRMQGVLDMLKRAQPMMEDIATKYLTPERMLRLGVLALRNEPKLLDCAPETVVGAIVTCAQLGLEPNTELEQAHLIPYGKECQLIIGYQGYIELARRSGKIKAIVARVVHENDEFELEFGLHDDTLRHVPAREDPGEKVASYMIARMGEGVSQIEVLWKRDIEEIKAAAHATDKANSPWRRWEGEMWKKSAIRRGRKMLPMTADFATAVSLDELADIGRSQGLAEKVLDSEIARQTEAKRSELEKRLEEHPSVAQEPKPNGKGSPSPEAAGLRKMLEDKGLTEDALIEHLGSEGEECQGIDSMNKKQRGMATKWIAEQGQPKAVQPSMI